jgi:phosphatidylglycerol:prolipoprotein diacylglycerol transferase
MYPIHKFLFFTQNNYEGIYFFTAILSAFIYFRYLAKIENIDLDKIYEGIFYGILAALITGRLFSFILWSPERFFNNPISFFYFNEGGITVTGSLMGGLTAGFIFARIKKLSFLYHMRIFIPAIFLGHVIGRFGCFLNGDAGGVPTNLPWGVVFDPNSVAYTYTGIAPGTRLHPTQIYEMIGTFLMFLFVTLTYNNEWFKKRMFIWYALGYTTVRFIVEFWRADVKKFNWMPYLSSGQLISLVGWLIGAIILVWSIFNDNKLDVKEENIARLKK